MSTQVGNVRELRTIIMDTAVEVFARKGYRITTIQDIAFAMHVPPSFIYYYFKNKRSLYESVILRYLKERREDYERIDQENVSFFDMLWAHLRRCVTVADESFLLDGLRNADSGFQKLIEYNASIDIYLWGMKRRFVLRAMRSGELRSDLNVDELVGFLYVQFYGLLRLSQDLTVEATVRQIGCVADTMLKMDIWGPNAAQYRSRSMTELSDIWKRQ